MGIPKLLALLLVPAYVVLIAVLDTLQTQAAFEPALLLFVLNTFFLGILPVAVAYIAARVYLKTGSSSFLVTGCGMLTFGLCTIPAGWLIGMPGGPNMTVTMHNTGALVGAFLLALGSILNLVGRKSQDNRGTGKQTIAKAYGSVCIFVVIFTFATVKGLVPSFFIQGVGPTPLRQVALATAIILFFLSSAFVAHSYAQWKSDFLYWYSLGLALIAIGLCAIFLQQAVGSPIGWLGRSAQYLGGVFSFVGIVTAWRSARSKGLPIERIIANFLADAEAGYRDLVETVRDAIISLDQEGRIIGWNFAAETMFGYTKGDAIGSSFFESLIPEQHIPMIKKEIGTVAARPKKGLFERHPEIEGKRKDGSFFPIEASVSVRDLPTGRVTTCIMRDVTKRKKAEKDLREAGLMLQIVLDTIPAAVFWKDRDSVYLGGNRTLLEAVGMNSSQEIEGKTDYDLPWEKDQANSYREYDRKVMESGIPEYNIIEPMMRADGNLRWVKTNKIPLRGQEGNVVGILGTYEDITDRKDVEEALRKSEQRLNQIINFLPDATLAIDREGRVIVWNRAMEEMTGVSAGEMIGKGNYEYALPFYGTRRPILLDLVLTPNDEIRQTYSRFEGDREFLTVEAENATPLGKKAVLWAKAAPLYDMHGAIIGAIETIRDVTDRKRAEESVAIERQRLYDILETMPVMVCLLTPDYHVPFANRSFREKFGESHGRHCFDYCFGLTEPCEFCETYNVLKTGKPHSWEVTTPDGSIIAVHDFPFTDTDGSPLILELDIDVTEQRRSQEALRESEERFRHISSLISDIAYSCTKSPDAPYSIDWLTGGVENITGYSIDEMKALGCWRALVVDEDLLIFDNHVVGLTPGTRGSCEFRLIRKTGEIVWIASFTECFVHDPSTHSLRLYGGLVNITERKKAGELLYESEARYQILFNDSKDGVYMTNRDGELIEANQAFLELFGYAREEMIGTDIRAAYVNPADRDLFVQAIEAKGFLKDYPIAFRKNDGKEMDCLITASLRRTEDGTALGYHGIVRDITEQKNIQRQLLQAQKMEAIGTLSGGIAHDFNNLLTVVMGFSELLLAEKDRKHPEYADLQKIFHAAKNGADLVQRLLMFSRKSEPKPVPMDLNKQIVQVEKMLRRTIPKMIRIDLNMSPDLPRINADPSQIEQVLMNLAVNARDAMPDNGNLTVRTDAVTLDEDYCRLHVEASPGEYVLLEISDTGHGMDKETAEHIFEPFFTTKEMGKGTGLGLAMVYGIVKQHKGHITVYSEVGRGTTFRVYFPAIPSDVEPEVEDSGIMPAFGTETVLLVDDEDLVSDLGVRILTKHGYTVLRASDGREALDLFKKESSQISLVILDLIMPEMGGTECLKELLKINPRVKVLVASGYSGDASVKDTLQMGAKGFVSKPFRVKELLRDVRRVLDEK